MKVSKIISGGQTGADRAALDIALELGIPCGGWCPKGRIAEDGTIPSIYPLKETETSDYAERTELNVKESDGTLVFTFGNLKGGTALTVELANKYKKPILVLNLEEHQQISAIKDWIKKNNISTLNIAGSRESENPGIYRATRRFLLLLLFES